MRKLINYTDNQNPIEHEFETWEEMLDFVRTEYGLSPSAVHELLLVQSYERPSIKLSYS
jgi:hypothetical protein